MNVTLDRKQISQLVQFSEYHFQSMLRYLSGQSLNQYIAARRLSLAALDRVQMHERIEVTEPDFVFMKKLIVHIPKPQFK